jgi:hypothetical protein
MLDFSCRTSRPQSADLPVVPICRSRSSLIAPPNHRQIRAIPLHQEGRLAIVTNAEQDAVDANVLATKSTEADGEVVAS